MPITKAISSKTNTKQLTNADSPNNPNQVVTATYGPVTSTASQTVINMSFAVNTSNTANFLLIIDGKVLSLGAGNDYTFTNIQGNGTSSQVTLNQALTANLNIQALYLGVVVPTFSLSTLTASVNALTAVAQNQLINGNFDFWQRGTTVAVATGTSTYQADRWYAKNSLGGSGSITYSQVAPVNVGSKFGASLVITGSGTTNGCELYQVVENLNTLPLLNQNLSFSVLIKGLNNVTSIGLQFFYATTETKVTTALGSEQSVTVTNGGFVLGKLQAINPGTTPTSTGVIGIRIRILGVSTGNTYDISNGFVVEQAMLNIGSTAANFLRAGNNINDELLMCQRYYEKSYDVATSPTALVEPGALWTIGSATSGGLSATVIYKASKRVSATISTNNPFLGGASWENSVNSGSLATSVQANGTTSFSLGTSGTPAAGTAYRVQWTADADI